MNKKQKLWLIVLAGYIGFIYGHSFMNAELSSAESSFVLQAALDCLDTVGVSRQWFTEHTIRKSAHFAEYAGMGFLLYQNLKLWQQDRFTRFTTGALAVVVIPFIDETIQLFSEGRAAMIEDVWLDMSGAVSGLIAAGILAAAWRRIRRRN